MLKHRFERFSASGTLHFAAHSHHLWPDVAFEAHQQAWLDAARLIDDKWDLVFGEVIPEARRHVARLLGVPDPDTIVFAANTHELVVRVASCLTPPFRVVTSDAEFHSFRRQSDRWKEAGTADVVRVAAESFSSFPDRFIEASAGGDLVYLSHVFFDSGYVVPDLGPIIAAARPDAFVVVDGYHAVMALPVDISPIADRVFYLGGGYKYAMAGEGACFMHCPPGWGERPVDTGWYAGFDSLTTSDRTIGYAEDASRFWGATFDPSACTASTPFSGCWRPKRSRWATSTLTSPDCRSGSWTSSATGSDGSGPTCWCRSGAMATAATSWRSPPQPRAS